MTRILVTGAAGFIGFHLSKQLLAQGHEVIAIDNLNAYYDVSLKQSRLDILMKEEGFQYVRGDIKEQKTIEDLFTTHTPEIVVHMAAQAGVRYSLENPSAYIDSNIVGFSHILEACRQHEVKHLVYASSSSVYGANTQMPFSVHQNVDHPISLYGATKKSNELMAHSYSHLFGLPTTGLRFFTVYGPWGRPDMAMFLFTKAILEGKPIQVFHHGKMKRDFTYIDDIVQAVSRVITHIPTGNTNWDSNQPDPASSNAPYKLYNIGNHNPVELLHFIEVLEEALGKKAEKTMMPLQAGDVLETYADVSELMEDVDFAPDTSIEEGIGAFVAWYKDYYQV